MVQTEVIKFFLEKKLYFSIYRNKHTFSFLSYIKLISNSLLNKTNAGFNELWI